jgi:hypothetical protein
VISESRLKIKTLRPKGKESDLNGWVYSKVNGRLISGSKMAPKVFKIIYVVELGNPVVLPYSGSDSAKSSDGAVGRGNSKKRKITSSWLYRGSKFAST